VGLLFVFNVFAGDSVNGFFDDLLNEDPFAGNISGDTLDHTNMIPSYTILE
jgi:hypothetical protein